MAKCLILLREYTNDLGDPRQLDLEPDARRRPVREHRSWGGRILKPAVGGFLKYAVGEPEIRVVACGKMEQPARVVFSVQAVQYRRGFSV